MKEKGHKMEILSNLEIERGILSAILFDTEFEKVKNILDKKDFYLHFHQNLFEAMGVLNDKNYPIDEIMLREELTKHNKFNEALMSEIITMAPIEMIEAYATTIKELSFKRQLNKLLDKGKINLLDNNDTDTLVVIEELKQSLEDINKNNNTDIFKFVDLTEVEDKEIGFILEDFLPIPRKAVTLLNAKGGTGKSWLVLQLALRYINQNTDKKVFAWLSEDPISATKKRAEKIMKDVLSSWKGMKDLNLNSPLYRNFKYLGSETRPFHFIEYDFKSKKINNLFYKLKHSLKNYDFIILDPLIAFFGGDENNNSQAREFMNLLTEWADKEEKTIIVVHHNSKSIDGGIRGAGAFVDAVRLQYELKLYEDKDKNKETDNGKRKVVIIKDNCGVGRILHQKEKEVHIFGDDLKVNVIGQEYKAKENNKNNNKKSYRDLI
jgi:replicative DNA helicase